MAANYFNKDKASAPVKKKRINWQQSLKTSETKIVMMMNGVLSMKTDFVKNNTVNARRK